MRSLMALVLALFMGACAAREDSDDSIEMLTVAELWQACAAVAEELHEVDRVCNPDFDPDHLANWEQDKVPEACADKGKFCWLCWVSHGDSLVGDEFTPSDIVECLGNITEEREGCDEVVWPAKHTRVCSDIVYY